MNDELLEFHGFVRSPFQQPAHPGKLLQPYSISVLIDDISVELRGGGRVIGVRGVRGIGKTCFAHMLATTLEAREFRAVQSEGACISPRHVQRQFGEAAGLSGDMPDPARLLAVLQRKYSQARLVLIVDDAEQLEPSMCKYLWQMLELCRLQSIRLHLVMIGDIGAWPGLNAPGLNAMRRAAISRHMIPCLSEDEAAHYLDRKLGQAGRSLSDLMTPGAASELIAQSGGIPQHLNELAELALASGSQTRNRRITLRALRTALAIVPAQTITDRLKAMVSGSALAAAASVVLLAGGLGIAILHSGPGAGERATAGILPAQDVPPPAPRVIAATLLVPENPPADPEVATLASPQALLQPVVPPVEQIPAARPAGRGLVLIAAEGDSIENMYDRVYRGLEPPPYKDFLAANAEPIGQGSLVVFPEPPHGWVAR